MFVCCMLSRVQLFVTPWSVAPRPLHLWEFSREEYWSGFPCPAPGDLLNPGTELRSPTLQENSLLSEPTGKPIDVYTPGF